MAKFDSSYKVFPMKTMQVLLSFLLLVSVLHSCASSREQCCAAPAASSRQAGPREMSVLGEDLSSLSDAFNARSDRWRVLALVSPTCSECVLGAEAVEKEITQRYGPDRVAALVVWIPMIPSDNEKAARESAAIFPADRAVQFYDAKQEVGWGYSRNTYAGFITRARKSLPEGHPLAETFENRSQEKRPQWDLYMLYAPGVRWDTKQGPPMPTHWIRHVGRMDGEKSTYWRDTPDAPPREGDLFDAMREMVEEAIGKPVAQAQLQIEVLGFEGCPNTPATKENVEKAIASLGLKADVAYVDQEKLPTNDSRRGWPTPTVLVDGRDLFGMASPKSAAMGCRIYSGGAPGVTEITQALKGFTR